MEKPNAIKDRDKKDEERKFLKKILDGRIDLSNEDKKDNVEHLNAIEFDTKRVRLLDEGAVLYDSGEVRFFIKRGAIKEFYENLSDDYVGAIKLGHIGIVTMPILLGTWTKEDLTLVHIENDRYALDVELRLNEELNIVKDLKSLDYTLGTSAEFYYTIDEEESRNRNFPVYDSINITDFAIVGDVGNVNSGGISLKGEAKLLDKKIAKLAGIELPEEEVSEEEKKAEVVEEPIEDVKVEKTIEVEMPTEVLEKLTSLIEKQEKQIETLTNENEELKTSLEETNEKVKLFNEKTSDVLEKFTEKLSNVKADEAKVKKEPIDPIYG